MAFLKLIGAPGSINFFFVSLAIGVVATFVWPRSVRFGRIYIPTIVVAYLLMAVPVVANALAKRLGGPASALPPAVQGTEMLVVFDGDNRRGRLRRAVEIYRDRQPRSVLVLGETWLLDNLMTSGVPPVRLRHNGEAMTTQEQITQLRYVLDAAQGRVVVIVSRLQYARVDLLIRRSGLDAILVSAPIDNEPPTTGRERLVPSYFALRVSRDAIYEHLALIYYRLRRLI